MKMKSIFIIVFLLLSLSSFAKGNGRYRYNETRNAGRILVQESKTFKNEKLTNFARYISRKYNVDIIVGKNIRAERISIVTVKGEKLINVLERLKKYNLKYSIKGKKVFIDRKATKSKLKYLKEKNERKISQETGKVYTDSSMRNNFVAEKRVKPMSTNTRSPQKNKSNFRAEINIGTTYKKNRPHKYNDFEDTIYYNYHDKKIYSNEEYDEYSDNRFLDVYRKPLSTFAVDVDTASYSNIRRFLDEGQLPPEEAVRIEEMVNYFEYDYRNSNTNDPISIDTEVAQSPWNKANKLLRIGVQAESISKYEAVPSNIVFLVDVSGSMQSDYKLPLLKKTLKMMVDELRPEDRISIVTYSGRTDVILEGVRGNKKWKINRAIDSLRAGGSTAGSKGIRTAYDIARDNFIRRGNNRVILATDGDFNVGISNKKDLGDYIERKAKSNIFLTVLGFGTGNYKDAKMEELSNRGNGNYAYIDNISEAKKVLVDEFSKTMYTIAKDVKLQVEFNPRKVKEYRLIGYENRNLNTRDFNDDRKDAGDMGAGHTVTALYEIVPAYEEDDIHLRYQNEYYRKPAYNDEIATVKIRYKRPKGKRSKLMVHHIQDSDKNFFRASSDFRFATAVAEFGMILKQSYYKGNASYEQVLRIARSSKGRDYYGNRAEFIDLVEKAEMLDRY